MLTDNQYLVLSFIEQEYALHTTMPTQGDIAEATGLNEPYIEQCLSNPTFRSALENRGIPPVAEGSNKPKVLSQTQLAAIATMLDRHDTRSDKKKLQDLKIPSQTWAAWQRDPTFRAYYYQRANQLYFDALTEAPRAILDNVARGDLMSIKYVHEMTGTYSERKSDGIDVTAVLRTVIDILTSEITDPALLDKLSTRLLAVMPDTASKGAGLAVQAAGPRPSLPGRVVELSDL